MRVSVMSDLHLEFHDIELPGGDILCLAGDCFVAAHLCGWQTDAVSCALRKRFTRFVKKELSKYKHVFYVPGNHDFYRGLFEDSAGLLAKFLSEHAPHAKVLDNETVAAGGVAFIGSTLWATYGHGAYAAFEIGRNMNDFVLIRTKNGMGNEKFPAVQPDGRRIAVPDIYGRHKECMAYLRKALKWSRSTEIPAIVITHHAPSYMCKSKTFKHSDNGMEDAYYSNQHKLIEENPQIMVWMHGHTHDDCNLQIGDTRIISNQRGYFPSEGRSRYFEPAAADFDLEEAKAGARIFQERAKLTARFRGRPEPIDYSEAGVPHLLECDNDEAKKPGDAPGAKEAN